MSWGGGEAQVIHDRRVQVDEREGVCRGARDGTWCLVGGTTLNLNSRTAPTAAKRRGVRPAVTAVSKASKATRLPTRATPSLAARTKSGARCPDVAYVADPNTGVFVLDTYWLVNGMTLAEPARQAAVVCHACSRESAACGRLSTINTSLTSEQHALVSLYSNSGDFHDITSGTSGSNSAGAGYDLLTGLEVPTFLWSSLPWQLHNGRSPRHMAIIRSEGGGSTGTMAINFQGPWLRLRRVVGLPVQQVGRLRNSCDFGLS